MNSPEAGERSPQARPQCLYRDPDGHQCDVLATTHLLVDVPTLGRMTLVSCVSHLGAARRAAILVREHPYGDDCGKPGTVWCDNGRCHLDGHCDQPEPSGGSL